MLIIYCGANKFEHCEIIRHEEVLKRSSVLKRIGGLQIILTIF